MHSLLLPAAALACTTDMDCSLNGDCVSGACVCDAAWSGSPACDVLAIEPTDRAAPGYHNSSAASWGGNVVAENGTWHLFVAQMAAGCGLDKYGSNSEIVRAEAASPAGPFQFREVVQVPFAHNPTIRRLPNGTGFIIYFIGGNPTAPADCSNGASVATPGDGARLQAGNVSGSVHMITAPSVLGPWSAPVPLVFADGGVNSSSPWAGGGYNPAPHVMADGTVTLAIHRSFAANPKSELIGVARAASWRGPYTMLTAEPIVPERFYCVAGTGEDPFLWRTHRGWHIVYHGMCPTGVLQAHHAFSPDAVHWTRSPRQTYGYMAHYTDGGSQLFCRVERPQLAFAAGDGGDGGDFAGAPTHLLNGVCYGDTPGEIYSCLELKSKTPVMTWTLARPLKQ